MAEDGKLTFTRPRDLAIVFAVSVLLSYLLVRWNYGRLPVLPRLVGVSAAVLGIGEAIAGSNIRARLRRGGRPVTRSSDTSSAVGRVGWWGDLRPLPPLVGARAVMVAKASSLAGASLTGAWAGFLGYVAPISGAVTAAGNDTASAAIGVIAAAIMVGGALWLEHSCIHPDDDRRGS